MSSQSHHIVILVQCYAIHFIIYREGNELFLFTGDMWYRWYSIGWCLWQLGVKDYNKKENMWCAEFEKILTGNIKYNQATNFNEVRGSDHHPSLQKLITNTALPPCNLIVYVFVVVIQGHIYVGVVVGNIFLLSITKEFVIQCFIHFL